jgi:hypothetical protein
MSIQTELAELRERIARLEQKPSRRGAVNQRRAADYLGRSREWMRQRHLHGDGPKRNADGSYSLDELDRYLTSGP